MRHRFKQTAEQPDQLYIRKECECGQICKQSVSSTGTVYLVGDKWMQYTTGCKRKTIESIAERKITVAVYEKRKNNEANKDSFLKGKNDFKTSDEALLFECLVALQAPEKVRLRMTERILLSEKYQIYEKRIQGRTF